MLRLLKSKTTRFKLMFLALGLPKNGHTADMRAGSVRREVYGVARLLPSYRCYQNLEDTISWRCYVVLNL